LSPLFSSCSTIDILLPRSPYLCFALFLAKLDVRLQLVIRSWSFIR
jgi:hypothetical protein